MATKNSDVPPVSDDAVKRATGCDWSRWARTLDARGADKLSHGEIVEIVGGYGVGSWWQQTVTVGYERMRGLRKTNQTAAGFKAGVSRIVGVPVNELYAACNDAKWLRRAKLSVTTAARNRSIRGTAGGEKVELLFVPKGDGRSQVVVQHSKLKTKKDVAEKKAFWSELVGKLKEQLEA
jgi:hypothetical protein